VESLQDVYNNYLYDFESRTGRNGQNPFGVSAAGFYDADVGYFDFINTMNEKRLGIRMDFDSQLGKSHRLRSGIDFKYWEVDLYSSNLTSSTFLDYYTAEPEMQSFYIEDRMNHGDFIIDLGLRLDSFYAGTDYPSVFGQQQSEKVEPDRKTVLSPRLCVSHPVTEQFQVRASYGTNHQIPQFTHLYERINYHEWGNSFGVYGNPNLGFRKTTTFEFGATAVLSDDWVLDLAGYYKDRDGTVVARYIQQGEYYPYRRIFTNYGYGSVKGMETTLKKRFSDFFSQELSYSLLYSRASDSDPTDFVKNEGFFWGGDHPPLPPIEEVPNDFHQTHTITYQPYMNLAHGVEEGTFLGKTLRNTDYFFTMYTHSGRFYSPQDSDYDFVGQPNSKNTEWEVLANLRVAKGFDIGNLDYSVFVDIRNLFGNVNLSANKVDVFYSAGITNGVYQTSGSPYSDGQTTERAIDDLPVDDPSLYVEPRLWDISGDGIFDEEDVAIIASRLDFNGDGMVSVDEELAMRILARGAYDATPENFDIPRMVRIGLEVKF